MKRLILLLLPLSTILALGSDGSFTGQVVNGPVVEGSRKWVYVQSSKGAARRVEVSAAKITYSAEIARKDWKENAQDDVREGAEVRVTASQDREGEWKATRLEVLKTAPN